MLPRMMIVALLLGVSSAFADGIAVNPSSSFGATQAAPMMNANMSARMAVRMSGAGLYKALMFTKSNKYARPAEQGDITF